MKTKSVVSNALKSKTYQSFPRKAVQWMDGAPTAYNVAPKAAES